MEKKLAGLYIKGKYPVGGIIESLSNTKKDSPMSIQLLIVDPQIDFCDPKGALYVAGADKDMERLANLIETKAGHIDDIRVTLDSHRFLHVAHPIMWKDKDGNHPAPFTLITSADIDSKKWMATNPGFQKRLADYVKKLEANKKYLLVIWPPHCLIGSQGHSVYPRLFEALQKWEQRFATVDYVTKGSNMFTEHYSAVKADVTDPDDPTTQINTNLIKKLQTADSIWISGEALSHCVASTVRDIAQEFGDDQVKKFVLITDTCSPVTRFETQAEDFMREMISKGMQLAKTSELL